LNQDEHEALNRLAENKNIIITKADKGNAIVLQNRNDYFEKMFKLIEDKTKFECLEDDPTLESESELKDFLKRLLDKGTISQQVYDKTRPMGSKAGSLYGLPKVHKEGFPMRPIISSIGTYNYGLAKWLDSIIKPLLDNDKFMLKDSFEFVNNISKLKNKNGFMVSFDVESLFTNIPVDETIDLLVK
jgi:hypothetical protein